MAATRAERSTLLGRTVAWTLVICAVAAGVGYALLWWGWVPPAIDPG